MKKIFFTLLSFLLLASASLAGTFVDVSNDHPYYAAIESLVNLGIINGNPDGTFKPENPVNRAEAAKMIVASMGIEIPEINAGSAKSFLDIPNDAWFAKFIVFAKQKGIINGNPDGTFAPARQVNKAEFLKMLIGAFGKDISKHQNLTEGVSADTQAGQWFLPYFSYAKTLGIITPTLDNMLYPAKSLTRGECAEIIYKMLVLESGGDAQKLLSIAESNLVELLVNLNNNNIQAALQNADNAIFYSEETVKKVPEDSVAKGAIEISQGFRSLCLAYQAGLESKNEDLKNHVAAAKNFANEALALSGSFESLKAKIDSMGDVLLGQIQ